MNKTVTFTFRVVPPEIEALLPPHPIEFSPDDPDLGRVCARCGFSVPGGTRQAHADWCKSERDLENCARAAYEATYDHGKNPCEFVLWEQLEETQRDFYRKAASAVLLAAEERR